VRRGLVVVRPVGDRGDARVKRLQGAPHCACVHVFGGVLQRDAGQHGGPVPGPGDLGRVAADSALPHVTVRVHHAGNHQAACRVDHLSGCRCGLQIPPDSSDEAIRHQDITPGQVTQVRVDRHDVAALYQ